MKNINQKKYAKFAKLDILRQKKINVYIVDQKNMGDQNVINVNMISIKMGKKQIILNVNIAQILIIL